MESRSRNGNSPSPLEGSLYPFCSDQGTAPELSTYEHRLGVAISAASAIISVGATRGPAHGHPRWTPHWSGCIVTPGRSISVTMEALCLLLPVGETGDFIAEISVPRPGFGFRCVLLHGPNIGTPSLIYWEESTNQQHPRTDPAWQGPAAVVG